MDRTELKQDQWLLRAIIECPARISLCLADSIVMEYTAIDKYLMQHNMAEMN